MTKLIQDMINAKLQNNNKKLIAAAQALMSFDRDNPFVVDAKYVIVAKKICDKI